MTEKEDLDIKHEDDFAKIEYSEQRKEEKEDRKLLQTPDDSLGSEMAILRKIILEVSKTRKINGIIRAFEGIEPDDLESLNKILERADIPKAEIIFILENWAKHRKVLNPENLSLINKLKNPDTKKGDENLTDEEKLLDVARDESTKDLKAQLTRAKFKKEIRLLEEDDRPKATSISTVKRTSRQPVIKDGIVQKDIDGNVIYSVSEEEVPISSVGSGQSQGNSDLIALFGAMMTTMTNNNNQYMTNLITVLKDRPVQDSSGALRADMEKMILQMQKENEKQMLEMKHILDKKEMEETYAGLIQQKEKEIEGLIAKSSLSDDKFKTTQQTEMVKRGMDDAKEVTKDVKDIVKDLKETVKEGIDSVRNDMIAEKKHKRWSEKIALANKFGVSPETVQKKYEKDVVPDVSDSELLKELEKPEEVV